MRATICYRAAMLADLYTFWRVLKAILLTLGGVAFVVLIVRGASKGKTPIRFGGMVYRPESPVSFWFFVVFSLFLGAARPNAFLMAKMRSLQRACDQWSARDGQESSLGRSVTPMRLLGTNRTRDYAPPR